MFSGFEESRQHHVLIQDVDSKAFGLLLDYMYTSEIQIDEENVQVATLE